MTTPSKVLLIEDDPTVIKNWLADLSQQGIMAENASSLESAVKIFPKEQWDVIVFDGCLGGDEFNTQPLIEDFKKKVSEKCIMIAASSNSILNECMLVEGCTHKANGKDRVPRMIFELLRDRINKGKNPE